jgi:hypothetical protein
VSVLLCGVGWLQGPPSPQADHALVEEVRKLGDVDPQVRREARRALMQLTRSDLPALRQAVASAGRISPEQAAALEEIVIHVHVSGVELPRQPWGFLGVELAMPGFMPDGQMVEEQSGAVILSRMPGFAAFEALYDGDLIVGIEQIEELPVRSGTDLRAVISRFRAGDRITLLVVRGGQTERVPIRLSARPAVVDQGPLLDALGAFVESAERYYEANFLPVIRNARLP